MEKQVLIKTSKFNIVSMGFTNGVLKSREIKETVGKYLQAYEKNSKILKLQAFDQANNQIPCIEKDGSECYQEDQMIKYIEVIAEGSEKLTGLNEFFFIFLFFS